MKKFYNKTIELRCISCGDTAFEFNEDKSWVKCIRCGKIYHGGNDELVELNQEIEKTKKELLQDTKKDLTDMLKDAFNGNKNIKFKG